MPLLIMSALITIPAAATTEIPLNAAFALLALANQSVLGTPTPAATTLWNALTVTNATGGVLDGPAARIMEAASNARPTLLGCVPATTIVVAELRIAANQTATTRAETDSAQSQTKLLRVLAWVQPLARLRMLR